MVSEAYRTVSLSLRKLSNMEDSLRSRRRRRHCDGNKWTLYKYLMIKVVLQKAEKVFRKEHRVFYSQ